MMSRAPRWPETPGDCKTVKPTNQKTGAKQRAWSAAPVLRAGNQAVGVRSRSLNRTGSDAGGPISTQASRTAPSGFRLASSRSFSSLHTSSLSAAPFMRSSRSLSRLDQRSTTDDGVSNSQVKRGQRMEKKACSSGQLSSSGDDIRVAKEMTKASSSSSLHSADGCTPNYKKIRKQSRDGVSNLCAMTSGMRRNWVQTVLKNVRPSLDPGVPSGVPSSPAEETAPGKTQQPYPQSAEEAHSVVLQEPGESAEEPKQQQAKGERTSADEAPTISPLTQGEAESCDDCTPDAQTGEAEALKEQTEASDVQMKEQVNTVNRSEDQEAPSDVVTCEGEVCKKHLCEQQMGQLVKELEQTQRELSRLQQLNKSLQVDLQQERKSHPQNDGSNQEQAQSSRLQRLNQDLRSELEALKRDQEEAREAELRRRVDLLAQQAQLLVTGDATAIAQVQLEQDRQKFFELRAEWERCVASLQSRLAVSEEQEREARSGSAKLRAELESFHGVQRENDLLRDQLEEARRQLGAKEEAQAQKEARLEKHLTLLQASQDRERKSLATSLKQAEQQAEDLQRKLDAAEEQRKAEARAALETQRAKEELQEELERAASDVRKLQEEREQHRRLRQELQGQISAAGREASRLGGCLETSERQRFSLESSHERACEELQAALRRAQLKESETRDMQEGYQRLLDRKEQELCEVLLKMEVLGNSLEETEVKLNEVLGRGGRASPHPGDEPPETSGGRADETAGARTASGPGDSAYQDQEGFVSVIQTLESKLFLTEEKLRDIMQRLEEHRGACQDPALCSQLTQSRASAQHLGLLLHSQASRSRRFAQDTEACCGMLVGRFQVALRAVQACREALRAEEEPGDIEGRLAAAAACLQQGGRDAERHQREARSVGRGEEKILGGQAAAEALSAEGYLAREMFVVGEMVSVLQSQQVSAFTPKEDGEGVGKTFKSIISQRIGLKERAENAGNEGAAGAAGRACAEAELIYAAFRSLEQLQERTSPGDNGRPEEEVDNDGRGAARVGDKGELEMDRESDWLKRLLSRLKRREKSLQQLVQEVSEGGGGGREAADIWKEAPAADLSWFVEEARLIYLSERLALDLEQEGKGGGVTKEDGQSLERSLPGLGGDEGRAGEGRKISKDMRDISVFHEKRLRALEKELEGKVTELQRVHEEEAKQSRGGEAGKQVEGDQRGNPRASRGELGERHLRLIQDLRQRHEREVAALLRETERRLSEETAATLAAIAAMRRAHGLDLGTSFPSQEDADAPRPHGRRDGEAEALQRELQLVSGQHRQKCLENSELSQQLHDQGQALEQCQKQIQELKTKQRDEIPEAQLPNGKQPHVSPRATDRYEMEVLLRAKEAEMEFLRQEAHLLKEDLKITRMDKINAQNKLKALYMKNQDDPCRGTSSLRDSFKFSTWSPTRGASGQTPEDAEAKTSSAAGLKKPEKSSLLRQIRGVRSKSLKDGLSAQERMKLFDSF